VSPDGSLTDPVRIEFPQDTFPDGMAFDAEGGLWIVCVITNRLIRLAPDLSWTVLFEDLGPSGVEAIDAYAGRRLTFDDIGRSRGARTANLSSIAFGGPDLTTLYLGSLGGDAVHVLPSPVAGLPMAHWR
jgi:sugar lactone lactonase YvrE